MCLWRSGYEASASASASASEASASASSPFRMRVLKEACGVCLYFAPHARVLLSDVASVYLTRRSYCPQDALTTTRILTCKLTHSLTHFPSHSLTLSLSLSLSLALALALALALSNNYLNYRNYYPPSQDCMWL